MTLYGAVVVEEGLVYVSHEKPNAIGTLVWKLDCSHVRDGIWEKSVSSALHPPWLAHTVVQLAPS